MDHLIFDHPLRGVGRGGVSVIHTHTHAVSILAQVEHVSIKLLSWQPELWLRSTDKLECDKCQDEAMRQSTRSSNDWWP